MAELWIAVLAAEGGAALSDENLMENHSDTDGSTQEEIITQNGGNDTINKTGGIGDMDLLWAGLGLSAGVLLSLAAMGIARLVRKRRGKQLSGSGTVSVQKLHEQGARKSQQDSFFVSEEGADFSREVIMAPGHPGLLAVVADGMGGQSGGGDRYRQWLPRFPGRAGAGAAGPAGPGGPGGQ